MQRQRLTGNGHVCQCALLDEAHDITFWRGVPNSLIFAIDVSPRAEEHARGGHVVAPRCFVEILGSKTRIGPSSSERALAD